MSFWKIFFAVVLANVVSWIIVSLIGLLCWFLFFSALADAVNDVTHNSLSRSQSSLQTLPTPRQSMNNIVQSIQPSTVTPRPVQKLEKPRKPRASASARQTHYEMCQFWAEEARKESTTKNKTYRDVACKRYHDSFK